AAVLSWVLLVYLRLRLPSAVGLSAWSPGGSFPTSPVLRLDFVAWPFALAISSLVLAEILTRPARTTQQMSIFISVASLFLGGFGLFGVLAGNPLTLMIAWAALDLGELVILLGNVRGRVLSMRSVIAFASQTSATFFVLWAVLSSWTQGTTLAWDTISGSAGIFLLLAAGLRLGVLPLHLPFAEEPDMRRGLGTLLRLIPTASSLVLLARMPVAVTSIPWIGILAALTASAGLYAAGMWSLAADEISGRPYWIIGMASLAVISALHGQPTASLAWGVILLLTGGMIFLYSARSRRLSIFWALGAACITGLPFTLASSGWTGLISGNFSAWIILSNLTVVLLIFGFVRHALKPGEELHLKERWVQGFYPMGFFVITATLIFLDVKGWNGSFTAGPWYLSVPVSAAVAWLGIWWAYQRRVTGVDTGKTPLTDWAVNPARRVLNAITAVLRLEWLYRLVWLFFRQVERLLTALTAVFEGEGGVLWAFVLLSLVITLLQVRITP
ncbi:MAG TPA: hypothetical protein VF813_01710, partial [Anaerolineaceae bacterium]